MLQTAKILLTNILASVVHGLRRRRDTRGRYRCWPKERDATSHMSSASSLTGLARTSPPTPAKRTLHYKKTNKDRIYMIMLGCKFSGLGWLAVDGSVKNNIEDLCPWVSQSMSECDQTTDVCLQLQSELTIVSSPSILGYYPKHLMKTFDDIFCVYKWSYRVEKYQQFTHVLVLVDKMKGTQLGGASLYANDT